jgi:hypothetical protein
MIFAITISCLAIGYTIGVFDVKRKKLKAKVPRRRFLD